MLFRSTLACLCWVSTATAFAIQLPFSRPPSTAQQPGSSSPVDWPYRALEWGEVNIISTTDT